MLLATRSFDVDNDGSVSAGEFEGLLIDVQAQNALHDAESDAAVDPIYALAGQVQEELGDKGAENTFLSIFSHALDKRLSAAASETGLIQLWDYRTILRQVPMQGLAPFTRSNLLNIFDQVRPSYPALRMAFNIGCRKAEHACAPRL